MTTNNLGFTDMPVRFFIWNDELNDDGDYTECDEPEFLQAEGVIEYDRFSMHENGCTQICLTKNPFI